MKLNKYLYAFLVAVLATCGLFGGVPTAHAADGQADLSVSLSELRLYEQPGPTDPDHVMAATSVVFDVTVTNNDPDVTATEVIVTLPDPGFIEYDSSERVQPCMLEEGAVRCSITQIAAGGSDRLQVSGWVRPGTFGEKVYSADVTSLTVDPDSSNNHAERSFTFTEQADMSVGMVVNGGTPGQVGPDGLIEVELSMTNGGDITTYNNEHRLTWSEGLTLVGFDERSCAVSNEERRVACYAPVAPGNTASMTVRLQADPGFTGPFTLYGFVMGGQYDPIIDNNSIEYTVLDSSAPVADVSLTNTANVTKVKRNQQVIWTTTVTNAGPATAEGLELTDIYPEGMRLVKAPKECVVEGGRQLECALQSLPVGETWTMQFVVKVQPGNRHTSFINYAELRVASADPDGQWTTATSEVTLAKGKPDTRPTRPPT